MKLAWIIFGSVMALLLAYGIWNKENIVHENIASDSPQSYSEVSANGGLSNNKGEPGFFNRIFNKPVKKIKKPYTGHLPKEVLPDSIVAFGISLMGSPYLPAGVTCDGFDCSGFVFYIFEKYGVSLPHSSAMLANEGVSVALNQTRKGDLLIFTGTNVSDRTPGHVGVVITEPGQPVEFVHSSSAGGVKISKVAGTGYEKRFLQARRVL